MSAECTNSAFFTKYAVNVTPLSYETPCLPKGNDSGFQEQVQQHDVRMPIPAIDNNTEIKHGVAPHGPFSYPLSAMLPLYETQAPGAYNSEPGILCNGNPLAMNSAGFQGTGYQQYMEKSAISEGRISMLDYAYDWPSYLNATAAAYFQSQTLINLQGTMQNGADCQNVEARSSKWETGQLDGEYCSRLLENFNSYYPGFSREVLGERNVLVGSSQPSNVQKSSNQMDWPVRTSSEKTSRKKMKLSQSNSSTDVWTSGIESTTSNQPAILPRILGKPCKLKDLVRASKRNSLKCMESETLQSQQTEVEDRTLVPLVDALPSHSIANHAQLAVGHKNDVKGVNTFGQGSNMQAPPPVPYSFQHETYHTEENLLKDLTSADTNSVHMDCDNNESERFVLVSSKRSRGRGVKCGARRRKNVNRDIYNGRQRHQDLKLHRPIHKLRMTKDPHLVSTTSQIESIASQFLQAFPAILNLPKRHLDSPKNVVQLGKKVKNATQKDRIQQDPYEKASKPSREPDYILGEYSQNGCIDLHNSLTAAEPETSCLHSDNASQILKVSDDMIAFTPVQQTQQQATSTIDRKSREYPEKKKVSNSSRSWHAATIQSTREFSTSRSAEVRWAVATNHLPEKDEDYKEFEDPAVQSSEWAMERLKRTTQLMQNIILPLPATMMQDSTVEGLLCGVYTLARLSMGEACKMACGSSNTNQLSSMKFEANGSSKRMDGDRKSKVLEGSKDLSALIYMERVRERIDQLDKVLLRITNSSSIFEIVMGAEKLEKLGITNRLVKHHCQELFLDLNRIAVENDSRSIAQKASMQKYVKAVRMPKKIPEGFECLRL